MSRLWYVYDPRETEGYVCRLPRTLARALTRIRPYLDYAPNEDGTETEPYPDTYASSLVRLRKVHIRYLCALVLVICACLVYVHLSQPERTDTQYVPTCWAERDSGYEDSASVYCGTSNLVPRTADFVSFVSVYPGTYADCEEDEVLTPLLYDADVSKRVYVCTHIDALR